MRPHRDLHIATTEHNQIGWGVDAGVKINLPSFGAGDDALLTGSYTQSAVWYSGLPDMMWGENGQVNGNGQPMYMQDAYFNPITNSWSKPTAWSVSALIEHHFTPQFYLDLEGSVGQLKWSNQGGGCSLFGVGCAVASAAQGAISPSATTWLVGADLGWNPVNNLNFDLELMYQSTNQSTPNGFLGTIYNCGPSERVLRAGRLARRQRRLRRPLPHHPLLLIACRSVDLHQPRSESSGVFCRPGVGESERSFRGRARPICRPYFNACAGALGGR